MDYLTKVLIPNILAPAVIAALVGIVFTMFQKWNDYKNEYYKKIIENRFRTYALIQDLLSVMSSDSIPSKDAQSDKRPFLILFLVTLPYFIHQKDLDLKEKTDLSEYPGKVLEDEIYYFELFRRDLEVAIRQGAWLSKPLEKTLAKLFKLLANIKIDYDKTIHNPYEHITLVELGKENHNTIVEIRDEIRYQVYIDLLTLHKAAKFMRTKAWAVALEEFDKKKEVTRFKKICTYLRIRFATWL